MKADTGRSPSKSLYGFFIFSIRIQLRMSKKRLGSKMIISFVLCFAKFFAVTANTMHALITYDAVTQEIGKFRREGYNGYAYHKDYGITTDTTQIASPLSYGVSDPTDTVIQLTQASHGGFKCTYPMVT
jgi:hypothetical protein